MAGLLSTTGQLVNSYNYDPYGNLESQAEGVAQPLKYGARELDAAIGLYYLRARWYDPELGRFVSEDPIGLAGGLNPYAYVGSSPTNGTDPSGLCPRSTLTGWTGSTGGGGLQQTVVFTASSTNCDWRDHEVSMEALARFSWIRWWGRAGWHRTAGRRTDRARQAEHHRAGLQLVGWS